MRVLRPCRACAAPLPKSKQAAYISPLFLICAQGRTSSKPMEPSFCAEHTEVYDHTPSFL